MAGGTGERFWPLSTPKRPKQLLRLADKSRSLIEQARDRIVPLVGAQNVFVATSRDLAKPIAAALDLPAAQIFAEPLKRNTLGAVVWTAASLLAQNDEDASIAILTSDHAIGEPDHFRATVGAALDLVEDQNALAIIGIPPSRPETGFGYIEVDKTKPHRINDKATAFGIAGFREKPPLADAEAYVRSGSFLWNSGMLFFRLQTLLAELKAANPQAHELLNQIALALKESNPEAAIALFESLPSISFDYALLEKTPNLFVLESNFPWDDVGAWDALHRAGKPDSNQNVAQGRTLLLDSTDCVAYNDDDSLDLALIGVKDLVVVATKHGVLVCPRDQAQRVKEIVAMLNKRQT